MTAFFLASMQEGWQEAAVGMAEKEVSFPRSWLPPVRSAREFADRLTSWFRELLLGQPDSGAAAGPWAAPACERA